MIFIQAQYCDTVREQLETSEKPTKPGGRLIANGMPRLLSDDAFVAAVEAHTAEQARRELKAEQRKKAREHHGEALKLWRRKEEERKKTNVELKQQWQRDVEEWKKEREQAKKNGRKSQVTKPLLKDRLLKPIPKAKPVVEDEDREEWLDSDDDDDSIVGR